MEAEYVVAIYYMPSARHGIPQTQQQRGIANCFQADEKIGKIKIKLVAKIRLSPDYFAVLVP